MNTFPGSFVLSCESLSDRYHRQAVSAIGAYTREKMYRLWHIPMRYYIDAMNEALESERPCAGPAAKTLRTLYKEIGAKGHIDLDRDGTPTVLSGKPAVLDDKATTPARPDDGARRLFCHFGSDGSQPES